MTNVTLPDNTTVASGLIIKSSDFLTVIDAFKNAFVGRNAAGIAAPGQSLGTALLPWGTLHVNNIIVGGELLNVSGLLSAANAITSGKTRTTSTQPLFIMPDGTTNQFTLEGAVTNLILSIDTAVVTVSTDIDEIDLELAPVANNTCLINDPAFLDQTESKYFGEIDSSIKSITIDNVGSEISSRVGQMIALRGTTEIMWGWLKSATELTNVKRGYFLDKDETPIVRETLADNDTLTLMETGWIFVENDGVTLDVTYLTPIYSHDEPTTTDTSQYWYDLSNQTWKKWSGSSFDVIGRKDVGLCVINATDCIGARSFDFEKDFKKENTIDLKVFSDEIIRSGTENSFNVYGTEIQIPFTRINWDNTANMEGGAVAADTRYYLYISTDGETFISLERPFDRIGDLLGRYHPYNNWLYIGEGLTDSLSDWTWSIGESTVSGKTPAVKFDSKNGLLEIITNTTVDYNADFLTTLDEMNRPTFLTNVDLTFDSAADIVGGLPVKNSHHYELYTDSDGNVKLALVETGFTDGTAAGFLVATANTFATDLFKFDAVVRNRTTGLETTISVTPTIDNNNLALADDIFVNLDEYEIIMKSPTGIGNSKSAIGRVYVDSGGNFSDVEKYGRARVTVSRWDDQNGYGSSSTRIPKFTTEVDKSNDIVVLIDNSATLGFTVTALMGCNLDIIFGADSTGTSDYLGISKNSSELTTSIQSIILADRVALTRTAPAANTVTSCTIKLKLKKGDVIRPHTNAYVADTNQYVNLYATEIT